MIKCPVCREYEFETDDNYEICKVCRWENDGLQLDEPDSNEGANDLSLNDFKAEWQKRNAPKTPAHQPAAYTAQAV
ncbi:MAG: hypothetical protein FWC70_07715 [Defluviitaleaceae bacterium]|nr:hypothetical protein [Defluviitaleaceae bacterium]